MAKVLIVEDEAPISRMYQNAMERAGHEVEVAEDGQVGLEKIDSFHPDIVLLDLNMPKVDGVHVFVDVKTHAETQDLPILILTNAYPEKDAQGAQYLGASDFIIKSNVEPDDIVAKVAEILEKKEQERRERAEKGM